MAWLRNFFFGNFLLKLFALILAVSLYVQIHKDTLVRVTTVEVKLILKPPRDLIITTPTPTSLKVTLQGPDSILKRSATKNWRYTLNLLDALPGSMQTELYTEQLRKIFPVELRVIRVQPSLLDLAYAKLGKKELPIKVPTRGKPRFGYRLIQIQSFPRVVTVAGPANTVARLKQIFTVPIDLRGKFRDQTMLVNLQKPDNNVRFVGLHSSKVSLTFLQRKIKRTIEKVPIRLLNFLNNRMDTKLTPIHANITLIGPQAQLQPLKSKDVIVTVDGSKLVNQSAGTYKLAVQAKPPNTELKVIKIEPLQIELTTTLRPGQSPPVKRKPDKSKEDDDDDDPDPPKKQRRSKSSKRRKRRRRYRRRSKRRKRTNRRRRTSRFRKRRLRKRTKKRKTGALRRPSRWKRSQGRRVRLKKKTKPKRLNRRTARVRDGAPSPRAKTPPPLVRSKQRSRPTPKNSRQPRAKE